MTESSIKNVTRGEQMLALRKRREAAAPPFLRGGFRPFFFGAATWAIIAIALWLCTLAGELAFPPLSRQLPGIGTKCCLASSAPR